MSEINKVFDDKEINEALGRFIRTLSSLEMILIIAVATVVGIKPGAACLLLSKTAGRAKADVLKKALKDKGFETDSELSISLKKIQSLMDRRNEIVHDPIVVHGNSGRWVTLRGKLTEDIEGEFEKVPLDPKKLDQDSEELKKIMKIIADKILVRYGGFSYV